jgi:predicted transcriptional regulator
VNGPSGDETGADAEPELLAIVGALENAGTRRILEAMADGPHSTAELAELVSVSRQTIYRRLDRLQDAGLVAERTRPRADGHHETVYVATLREFHVELTDDGFECTVRTEPAEADPADELTRLWGEFSP